MPNIEVTINAKTCKCGSVYAVPHWVGDYDHTCPMCAKKQIREANSRADEEAKKWMHMERQIASLRGAATARERQIAKLRELFPDIQ